MTLGAEFSAFAEAVSRDRWRTFKCEERLRTVNLGGTAIGTGLGAPRNYIFLVIEKLRQITGLGLNRAENLVGETANADVFVEVSGILKAHAATLSKISTDLRLLNLLGEINLPPVQAGSSIMPGKVNPVVCEAVAQASVKVCANDFIVTECAARGTFQINEFMHFQYFRAVYLVQKKKTGTVQFQTGEKAGLRFRRFHIAQRGIGCAVLYAQRKQVRVGKLHISGIF